MRKNKRKLFKVGIDVDDVLFMCIPHAIKRCNKRYQIDPPLKIEEFTQWGKSGKRTDIALEEFHDPDFFATQPVLPGAHEFIQNVCKVAEVFFVTAVPPEAMSIRAQMLMREFPEVAADHIIMTTSKNIVDLDILLDDGAHNILTTIAKYPVLFRRPWNQHITGTLAVNTYQEFLTLVNEIKSSMLEETYDESMPAVIALVGPSGSGKTAIAEAILKYENFEKPVSYTTRKMRAGEIAGSSYYFRTPEEFLALVKSGDIFEHTVYAGQYYGTSIDEIKGIISAGNCAILPIDMCGAMGLKANLENVITIYIDRRKADILTSIIERNISTEEKVKRIISLEAEMRNEELCDYTVRNYTSIEDAVKQILEIMWGEIKYGI